MEALLRRHGIESTKENTNNTSHQKHVYYTYQTLQKNTFPIDAYRKCMEKYKAVNNSNILKCNEQLRFKIADYFDITTCFLDLFMFGLSHFLIFCCLSSPRPLKISRLQNAKGATSSGLWHLEGKAMTRDEEQV